MSEAPGAGAILDRVLPFSVPTLAVRGRCVKLGPALDGILARHGYPVPVARLLAEASALATLLGTALKFEGRFQLQAKTDGPVDLLVVDFDTPDRFRAMARFDAARLEAAADLSPAALLGSGHLALTIDQGSAATRYQGVVALDGAGLEVAAQAYFRQSEQIPTRIRLAAGEVVGREGAQVSAGGLMVQFLPASPDRMRQADLHPGDAPEGSAILAEEEDDAWREARLLVETIEDHELIDPTLPAERLAYRLFHEQGVEAFPAVPLAEACRCSRGRILAMLRNFTAQERRDMVADDGNIAITCEFCSRSYVFEPAALEEELAQRD